MLKKTFNKKDLAKNLSIETGLSNNFSKKIIDDLISIISTHIKSGKLYLKNIGSFEVVSKKKRMGRNPKTKEKFIISARNIIKFIPSKNINKNL